MRNEKWSDTDLELIRTKYLEKLPIAEIAKLVNRSQAATAKQLTQMGVRNAYRLWTNKEINKLHTMFNAGMIYEDIAEALGRTIQSVQSQVKDLGLKRNRPWSQEEIDLVLYLKEEKLGYKEIGKRLNRTPAAIARILKYYRKNG